MPARGSEWPISSSVILSTAAAESVKLDKLKFPDQGAGVINTFCLLFQMEILTNVAGVPKKL